MNGPALFFCNLLLFINLPIIQPNPMQEGQQIRQLAPGKPMVRDLSGAESHSYQMMLSAGQYARVLVDQRGIDVVIKLIGPNGKLIKEFDADSRVDGQEIASWVADKNGAYRLDLSAKNQGAAPGQYVIQAVALRTAKEDERGLEEAADLIAESRRLYLAGKYEQALPLIERVREIRERVLGAEHPDTGEALNQLARLYLAKGDTAQALAFRAGANYIEESNLNLKAGSNSQNFEELDLFKRRTEITLSLQYLSSADDQQVLDLTFTTLLRRKARELDATIDTLAFYKRQARDADLFERLAEARARLAELRAKGPDKYGSESFRELAKPVEDRVKGLEAELGAVNPGFRAQLRPVTLDAIQAELPSDAALVEFAYFTPVEAKTEKNRPPRYLAYVIAARGKAKWIDLGEAAMIDQAINLWREALRNSGRQDVNQLARAVDEKIMQPVRSLLGAARQLLIAPDGAINLIPLAALVDEKNQYLIERYSISYLTTGRDLLRLQTPLPSQGEPLVVADPDFGGEPGRKEPAHLFFQPLPAAAQEVLALKDLFPSVRVWQGAAAAENAVKQIHGPRLLQLETRSFFLDNQDAAGAEGGPPIMASVKDADPDSSQSNPFTVQFAAAPTVEIAEERVKALSARGVDAYIAKGNVKGKGDFFRVRAGNFPNISEANKYGAELQKKGVITEFFVARQEAVTAKPLPDPPANLELSRLAAPIKNPMLRAGLALAGANQGKSGQGKEDDGLLTALETAYLDLSGTKVAVLPACDSGGMKSGEGIQALRRALGLAGAESQIISLWPIPDEAGKDLLIPYYMSLQQGEGRSEGLRQAQLRMLRGRKELHHPFFWAAMLPSGEWASLEGGRR